jgi:hypothetical protein
MAQKAKARPAVTNGAPKTLPNATYDWRDGGPQYKADPTEVMKRLVRLHKKQGTIQPSAVVDDARDPKSPYHDDFTWDDEVAAEHHRLSEARRMLGSLVVVSIKGSAPKLKGPTRAVIHARSSTGNGYHPSVAVMNENEVRQQKLAEALSKMDYWANQYSCYEELAEIMDAIRGPIAKAKAQLKTLQTKTKAKA